MKNGKKLLSVLLALTIVLSLSVSALAVDITVNEKNGDQGGTYEAYRLLDLTVTATEPGSGSAEDGGSGYYYTVNSKYSSYLRTAAGVTTDEAVIEYLDGLREGKDGTEIRAFADKVYKSLRDAGVVADATADGNQFSGLAQGYYLIVEKTAATDDKGVGVSSLVMLDTAGRADLTVTTKEDKPSSEKKVKDVNDTEGNDMTNWQDSADWDIGDVIPFQLKGTLPEDYDGYETYEITFHDKESAGLTFQAITSVKVGGKTLTANQYVLNTTETHAADCTFELTINVKALGATVEALGGRDILVEYTAELNENAVIGSKGNPNTMYMEFTNDHYGDTEKKGRTPDDTVIVFTFDMDVNKVDGEDRPLEGAGFTLYKEVNADYDAQDKVMLDEKGEPVEAGGKWYIPVELELQTGDEGKQNKFYAKGLDDGSYMIVETETPPGYNPIDPILFTVEATHDEKADTPTLSGMVVKDAKGETISGDPDEGASFKVDLEKGNLSTNVRNQTGLELPETGGMGTTLFYVAGGVLVAAAVVLLVTKKRVSGSEK